MGVVASVLHAGDLVLRHGKASLAQVLRKASNIMGESLSNLYKTKLQSRSCKEPGACLI